MEGFKWHQPPPQQPHETTTATALVSLTPVAPISQVFNQCWSYDMFHETEDDGSYDTDVGGDSDTLGDMQKWH